MMGTLTGPGRERPVINGLSFYFIQRLLPALRVK